MLFVTRSGPLRPSLYGLEQHIPIPNTQPQIITTHAETSATSLSTSHQHVKTLFHPAQDYSSEALWFVALDAPQNHLKHSKNNCPEDLYH
ncbi:MAG: hypothetical protein LKI34_07240 [Bifidobacterium tibiigranuli]|jgi:hypothetical protein|uniref:hypothetical protein n=1 Tax=Bifidobacterium tibiigranuli TaxID=2172043 RepID=UPI0026EEBB6A|nr:hypothetical protein [Bifidobacterium tibiigranuli]MCI1673989.1 hypothetical protein [Bifidobacterium tibiigranuli]MCI1714039.1 hypothetical protein [Bifidobacterium tibiigranuli]